VGGRLWAIGVLIVWYWCVQAKRSDRLTGYDEEDGNDTHD
jgi:hypothetical protein